MNELICASVFFFQGLIWRMNSESELKNSTLTESYPSVSTSTRFTPLTRRGAGPVTVSTVTRDGVIPRAQRDWASHCTKQVTWFGLKPYFFSLETKHGCRLSTSVNQWFYLHHNVGLISIITNNNSHVSLHV